MSATATAQRVFNFSAGPATMPLSVLQQVQDELLSYSSTGASVMEISHRSKDFVQVIEGAEATIRSLLGIGDDHAVLFLQGGAALQFSMIPANLLKGSGKTAQYALTGSWGKKAFKEAAKEGDINAIYDAADSNYNHAPTSADMSIPEDSAYFYYCSNETIQGVQFPSEPECPNSVPLVCDASSDFLCRPLPIEKYGLLYACAQKNAGPAGVTVVIVRRDLLERSSDSLPGYLNYNNHAGAGSMWNTPPTFPVYVLGLIAKWLETEVGGLAKMEATNREKSKLLYDVIDSHSVFYHGHAQPQCRSLMNVTFTLPNDDLQSKFIEEAAKNDLANLKGHRSVGGIRASIYNAMPREGVEALAGFMADFAGKNG